MLNSDRARWSGRLDEEFLGRFVVLCRKHKLECLAFWFHHNASAGHGASQPWPAFLCVAENRTRVLLRVRPFSYLRPPSVIRGYTAPIQWKREADVSSPATEASSTRELANVMDFVMLNHAQICNRWRNYFHGDISFYC